MVNENDDAEDVRLDVWLDVACLFRTRSEAQKACRGGKVDVNGQPAKPNRRMRTGDEVLISRPFGRKQRVQRGVLPLVPIAAPARGEVRRPAHPEGGRAAAL